MLILSKRIKKRLKKAAGIGHGRPIKKSLFDELLNLANLKATDER